MSGAESTGSLFFFRYCDKGAPFPPTDSDSDTSAFLTILFSPRLEVIAVPF